MPGATTGSPHAAGSSSCRSPLPEETARCSSARSSGTGCVGSRTRRTGDSRAPRSTCSWHGPGSTSGFRVELADLGASFAEGGNLPSWLEAIDVVVAEGLADGQVAEARHALGLFAATLERGPSAAGEAARVLLDARVRLAADDDVDAVRDAAAALRAHGAPWPLLKCLWLLGPRAIATEEVEEDRLRRRLGLPPGGRRRFGSSPKPGPRPPRWTPAVIA